MTISARHVPIRIPEASQGASAASSTSGPLFAIAGMWLTCALVTLAAPATASICGIVIFLGAFAICLSAAPALALLALPLCATRALELLAGAFITGGFWIDELDTAGQRSTAFFVLGSFYALWSFIAVIIYPHLKLRTAPNKRLWGVQIVLADTVLTLAVLWSAAMLAYYSVNGFPLLTGLGRWNYIMSQSNSLYEVLYRYRLPWVFVLGVLVGRGHRPIASGLAALLMLGVTILSADKITLPVLMVTAFAGAYFVARGRVALFSPVSLVAFALMGLAAFGYLYEAGMGGRSSQLATTGFLRRLPTQAGLWYVTYQNSPPLVALETDHVVKEAKSILSQNRIERFTPPYTGGVYMLLKYGSASSKRIHRDENSNLIMILYPYVLDAYGWVPLFFFNLAYFAYYAVFSFIFVLGVRRGDAVLCLASAQVLYMQMSANIGGDISAMLGPYAMVVVAFALIWLVANPTRERRDQHPATRA